MALPIPDEYIAEGVRIARFESIVRIEEALIGGMPCTRGLTCAEHHTEATMSSLITTVLLRIGSSIYGPPSASTSV
jgi:hypothetical protein